jgi:hypothetical protein
VIVEIFHEALALPSAPWQAGRAVPFERAWLARLEDALHETDEDALRESLRAWLDPAPR